MDGIFVKAAAETVIGPRKNLVCALRPIPAEILALSNCAAALVAA
jgi:hypothetical protein